MLPNRWQRCQWVWPKGHEAHKNLLVGLAQELLHQAKRRPRLHLVLEQQGRLQGARQWNGDMSPLWKSRATIGASVAHVPLHRVEVYLASGRIRARSVKPSAGPKLAKGVALRGEHQPSHQEVPKRGPKKGRGCQQRTKKER